MDPLPGQRPETLHYRPHNRFRVAYGVFNDDPGDNYTATLSFLSKDLNVANLGFSIMEPRPNTVSMVRRQHEFDNVLFGRTGDGTDGVLINFNNDVNLVPEGLTTAIHSTTALDATTESMNLWWGQCVFSWVRADDLNATGLTPEQAAANVQFDNCTFINGNEAVRLRGNAQPNHVINRLI